jgi:hypothetical protein
MKRQKSSRTSDRLSGNQEAYEEIQNFLEALDSYPESFARTGVSFEDHHRALIPVKRNGFGRARQNGATRGKAEPAQFPTL